MLGSRLIGERVGPHQQPRASSTRAWAAACEPGLERLARQGGDVPFRGDAAEPLGQPGQRRAPGSPVQQRGAAGPADQAEPARQPAQRVVRGGTAAAGVPLRQELSFVRGHVHADRAVTLAALAGQAQVEGPGHVVGVRRVHARPAAGELEQQPGPPAGGVLFLAGGPVARAHHVAAGGQARPDADAAPGGGLQAAAVVGERELGAGGRARPLDVDTQIGVEPPGPDHRARVHPVPRVPDALEVTERGDHPRRVHPRQQLRSGPGRRRARRTATRRAR